MIRVQDKSSMGHRIYINRNSHRSILAYDGGLVDNEISTAQEVICYFS